MELTLRRLLAGTAGDSFDDGIRLDSDLEPLGGSGGTVKPAIYAGAVYQEDRRWPPPGTSPPSDEPQDVYVIDNVPSQANRLEDALRRSRASTGVPEMILDLSGLPGLPPHLPRRLSSWQFPHRNADAYLRDSTREGTDFGKHPVGRDLFAATADKAAALVAWWPQALIYGFWQSHLGKKRSPGEARTLLDLRNHRLAARFERHEGLGCEGRPAEPQYSRVGAVRRPRPRGLETGRKAREGRGQEGSVETWARSGSFP